MYLVAFVTVIVAIVGVFVQFYAQQASEGRAQQTGLSRAMIQWHETALGVARYGISPADFSATGECSLTGAGTYAACLRVVQQDVPPANKCVRKTDGSIDVLPCEMPLPETYKKDDPYTFQSVLYEGLTAGTYFIITYVPVPPDGDLYKGRLCLSGATDLAAGVPCPAGQQLTFSFQTLYDQMSSSPFLSQCSFGIVRGGKILAEGHGYDVGVGTPEYTNLPASVPENALGVVSQVVLCSGC